MECIYNSTYSGRVKNLNPKYKYSMKPSALSKNINNLQKITENNIIKTSGEQPLLVYKKKEGKTSQSFDYKMNKKSSDKNMYISDGGLKLKTEKYNTGYSYTNTNANQNKKNIKSLRTYLESINANKLLKTPSIQNRKKVKTKQKTINSKKNIQPDENLLYKTVRGSSNRPIFQKKYYTNDRYQTRTGEGLGLKAKMKIQDKPKSKSKPMNEYEESKKVEENKNELIDSLISGAIKNNYFSIQNSENKNKITPKEILVEKKKQYLERNGIGISDVTLDENDYENNKQNEKDDIKKLSKTANNFNHIKLNNYTKTSAGFTSPKQKNIYMTLNNDTHFLNSKCKKQNKPIIDQFEYIKKINKLKRLNPHGNLNKREKNKLSLSEENGINNNHLNDSFRHKNQVNTQNTNKINNFIEKTYLHQKRGDNPSSLVDVNDEWPYSHKRSYRSPNELIKFVKEKKLQNKQKANKDELNKNAKLFMKFKNLYNLNFKRANNNTISSHQDKEKEKEKEKEKKIEKEDIKERTISVKLNSNNRAIKARPNNPGLKRKKEANEYFVGNSSILNNSSTLIDPNEYYLNVLESQQLLVNSGLNKIEDESDEETEEISDNNPINNNMPYPASNELNTSKEQIQKITKKESKKVKPDNVNHFNNNKNNINLNNLKNKNIIKNEVNANNNIQNNQKPYENNITTKKAINPKDVFKFVELIKSIIQRKVFVTFYQLYINHAINQQYRIAFTYFVAVCKHKSFRKIEEYCNYIAYSQAFRKLLIPFTKRHFATFVNNCYFRNKLEFFVSFLTKFFKYKIMERIFIFSNIIENNEEERQFELVILTIMKTLFSPHLRLVFDKLKKYGKAKSDNKLPDKREDKTEIKMEKVVKSPPVIPNDNLNQRQPKEDIYKRIHKRYLEYSPTHNNKAKSFSHRAFGDGNIKNVGCHSFDMDQWNQIQKKLIKFLSNDNLNKYDFNEDEIEKYKKYNFPQNNSFNSKQSGNLSSGKKKEKEETKINNIKNNIINEINYQKNVPNDIIENKDKIKNKENNENNENKKIIKNEVKDDKNIKKDNDYKENRDKLKEDNKIIEVKNNQKNNEENNSINQNKYEKTHNHVYMEVSNKSSNSPDIQATNNNTVSTNNKNDSKSVEKPNKIEEDKKDKNLDKNKIINIDKNLDKNIVQNIDKNENIKSNDEIQNKPEQKKEEKSLNIKDNKNNKEIINDNLKERKVELEEPLEKQNLNKTGSEIDISAERDGENSIEWEYYLNNSKNKLQNSTNSENIKSENSSKEKINLNFKSDKTKENPKYRYEDEVIIYKANSTNNENEEKEKIHEKKGLIDDDEIEEDEKEDKKDIKDKKKTKTLIKDKNTLEGSEDEYLEEFDDIEELNSFSEEKEKLKEKDKKDNIKDKNDKSRNINSESSKKEEKEEETIKSQEIKSLLLIPENQEKLKKIKDKEKFANDLADDILKKILTTEINSNKVKIIPHKSFKYDFFANLGGGSQSNLSASGGSSGLNLRGDLGLLGLGSLNDDLSLLNDSIMSSYTAFSFFNRTIKDIKRENSLLLYYTKIAPRLIRIIKEEIYLKYPRIYENISTPLKNLSVGLMMSLSLQDADMLRDNYKCNVMKESIKNIIDKEKILKRFEPINRYIRSQDNVTSDNFYDNMLNECLVDTAIDLINKERLYGESGDPLEWSSRTHELAFKYKKNEPKKLAKFVCSNLIKTLHRRIGLITENYENMNAEQINNERDKRLIDNIRDELDEDEYQWRNLEMEETQLKVEIADLIMDQLYNENIEILEHIQYSRSRPDLYQNKSIYACEEIPKLSFQQTTTEN